MQNMKPNIESLLFFFTRESDSKLERSGRKEVWLTSITQIIVFLVFLWFNSFQKPDNQDFCVVNLVVMGIVFYIWDIILIIRRLHDINADNAFVIIAAIPFFTSFVLFVLGFIPSDPVDNKWGRYTIWKCSWTYWLEEDCEASFLGTITCVLAGAFELMLFILIVSGGFIALIKSM